LPKSYPAQGPNVHIVGHPTAPIGMGEHARSVFNAFRQATDCVFLVDIYGPAADADPGLVSAYSEWVSPWLGDEINIFCINGDEVRQAFEVLEKRNLKSEGSYNIIYPAWELAEYPDEWIHYLERFDEVWAPSRFIADAIEPKVKIPVVHMPLACEVGIRGHYSRRYFKIPESSYCFFFSFDFLSYVERKNPRAVLESFRLALDQRPDADVRLVLKLNNADLKPEKYQQFAKIFEEYRDRVVLIQGTLTDFEMKALMWNIDCYVSLHRSEGFGRGLSEAMVLAKPVIATAYSGNLDFCNKETAFLIDYDLVPVAPGEYPSWEGQKWASPHVDAAASAMVRLIDDPQAGERVGRNARAHLAANFSFLSRGLAYAHRAREIWNTSSAARLPLGGKPERSVARHAQADA
jgi:glycosyltransferase involved in cell wall biosynthesis